MNLCTGKKYASHDEICHEGSECPLCLAIETSNDIESTLNDKIEELEKEKQSLENELETYRGG